MKHWRKSRPNRYEGYPALIKYSALNGNNEIKDLDELDKRITCLSNELHEKNEDLKALNIARDALIRSDRYHSRIIRLIKEKKKQIENRINTIQDTMFMVDTAIEQFKVFEEKKCQTLS